MKSSIIKYFLLPLIVSAAIILPDAYIFARFASGWWPQWLGHAYLSTSVLIIGSLGYAALMFSRSRCSEVFHKVGVIILGAMCVVLPKIGFVISLKLLEWLGVHDAAIYGAFAVSAAIVATVIYGATAGKRQFRIRRVEIASDHLPAEFDGYKIVQLSDIHIGSWQGDRHGIARAVNLVNSLQPDMVAFTGDLINSDADEVDEFMPELSSISAPDGVFSVLGNHDYGTYSRLATTLGVYGHVQSLAIRQQQMGWNLLRNENAIIRRGSSAIALAGVENSGNHPFPDRADLKSALAGTDGLFKVLLSHDPTHWRRNVLPETDVDVTLSGHTHDMQFSLFGLSPASRIYAEHNGLYTHTDGRSLFVNIGLGHLFPLRLGAWPEITLITLRKN